jgi:hypothetical protein
MTCDEGLIYVRRLKGDKMTAQLASLSAPYYRSRRARSWSIHHQDGGMPEPADQSQLHRHSSILALRWSRHLARSSVKSLRWRRLHGYKLHLSSPAKSPSCLKLRLSSRRRRLHAGSSVSAFQQCRLLAGSSTFPQLRLWSASISGLQVLVRLSLTGCPPPPAYMMPDLNFSLHRKGMKYLKITGKKLNHGHK